VCEWKERSEERGSLTLSVQRRLARLVLGHLVEGVLAARLALAEGLLDLGNVHL
jgi:hypothetical protein